MLVKGRGCHVTGAGEAGLLVNESKVVISGKWNQGLSLSQRGKGKIQSSLWSIYECYIKKEIVELKILFFH